MQPSSLAKFCISHRVCHRLCHCLETLEMMDWIPTVFIVFKAVVLSTGRFFAIKWHYDQGRKGKGKEKPSAVLRAGAKVAAVFLLVLVVLLLLTFNFGRMLGLDLTLP